MRAFACCVLAAAAGCGAVDDEAALRALIDAAEAAAEARDTGHFRDVVSDDYRDSRGNDRDDVIAALRAYFLTNRRIEVVTRTDEIAIDGGEAARVVVGVAVLSQRRGASLLGGLDGELDRVELELVKDGGEWRVIGADWSGERR